MMWVALVGLVVVVGGGLFVAERVLDRWLEKGLPSGETGLSIVRKWSRAIVAFFKGRK